MGGTILMFGPRDVLWIAIAILLSTSPSSWAAVSETTPTQLPRNTRPNHYDVSVITHGSELRFEGRVTIDLEVLVPTSAITLNALDLQVTEASLSTAGQNLSPVVTFDAAAQTATFHFARPVAAGAYQLKIVYGGKIGTQASGLFAIDYDTRAGKRRALFTQFENSDARRFLPCWDEPAYKATFTLTATVPVAEMAVSNMPIATSARLDGGLARVTFAESPKMSTYLLFFGLGEFERTATRVDQTEVGVIMQRGLASQASFALDAAKAVVHEYDDYFGIPYPLPKLDNVASPGQSEFFGAMENWGAIYTFEYLLLLDPSISTQSDRQQVFEGVAHETAHQWFGDLVTMRWWDDLWLNEGFASWMAARTAEKLHPEWNTTLAAIDVRQSAMRQDARITTHPIVHHVATVEQANQAFDSITYNKGESVIRMLEGYVGATVWRDGVRRYLKAHAYDNTVSEDLWRELDAVAGADKPVSTIARDFTLLPGVPMLRVDSAACSGGNTTLTLKQSEFSTDLPNKKPLRWHIPVIARTLGRETVNTLTEKGGATVTVPGCGALLVNAGQSGYYRTLYPAAPFAALRDAFAKLPAIDQLGVMDDANALSLTGLMPEASFLELVNVTPVDADPQVWRYIAARLQDLDDFYRARPNSQRAFRQFAMHRLRPVFAAVGWTARPNDSVPTHILRAQLIATLGKLADPEVIAEARRRYAAQETDPSAMPEELRLVLLRVVARHADAQTWDALHRQATEEKTPLIKDKLFEILAAPVDEALARRALDLALTDEPGATNGARMINEVGAHDPDLAFNYALLHRPQVEKLVDNSSRSRYFAEIASGSANPDTSAKLKAYAGAFLASGSRRAADESIADIRYRIRVKDERLPQIDAWLASRPDP
jgi:aminopeptidase N